ncbi:MAG TPA: hypothetical protein VFT91_04175 [Dehalococcoidia bacterium]|nr:hypothetical protein [Dehalococcoidia bacterium]
MRYAITAIMTAVLLAMAAACGRGEGATPTSTANSRAPQPLAAAPEGVLLVQEKEPTRTFVLEGDDVRQLSKGPWLKVSPDGQLAALVEADDETGRWLVRIVDAQGEQVFEAKAPKGSTLSGSPQPELAWSPDGRRLAYALPDRDDGKLSRVYTVAADGSDPRQVSEAAGHYSLIGWAGDAVLAGEWADDPSTTSEARLLVLETGVRELAVPAEAFQFWSFAPSPDGRRVAFYAGSPEAMEVWVAETESGQARKVASAGVARRPGAGLYVSARAPLGVETPAPAKMQGPPPLAWSPDGRRIAYTRSLSSAGGESSDGELWVVDIESGEDVRVAPESSWATSWSPDGRYLVETGSGKLKLIGANGIVRDVDVFATAASWSPGGKLVAGSEIGTYVVEPDTGAAREVRRPDGKALGTSGLAAWSPSGRYVAVSDPWGATDWSLYVVDLETAQARVLLEGGGFWPVAWMRLSSDEGTD